MGSTYDREQSDNLAELVSESKKESRKTTFILIVSVVSLAVALVGLLK